MKKRIVVFMMMAMSSVSCFSWPITTNSITVQVGSASPAKADFSVPQGETRVLEARFLSGTNPVVVTNLAADYVYQTDVGLPWYTAPCTVASGGYVRLSWGPAYDAGFPRYMGWMRMLDGSNPTYRLQFDIRMIETPGFTPNATMLTQLPIDFSMLAWTNQPWWSTNQFTANDTNHWSQAYGWGDHSTNNYVRSDSDAYLQLALRASHGATAYGWGDHSLMGYLLPASTQKLALITYVDAATNGAYPRTNPSNFVTLAQAQNSSILTNGQFGDFVVSGNGLETRNDFLYFGSVRGANYIYLDRLANCYQFTMPINATVLGYVAETNTRYLASLTNAGEFATAAQGARADNSLTNLGVTINGEPVTNGAVIVVTAGGNVVSVNGSTGVVVLTAATVGAVSTNDARYGASLTNGGIVAVAATNAENVATSHVARTDNPHGVTAAQAGAVATNDATYTDTVAKAASAVQDEVDPAFSVALTNGTVATGDFVRVESDPDFADAMSNKTIPVYGIYGGYEFDHDPVEEFHNNLYGVSSITAYSPGPGDTNLNRISFYIDFVNRNIGATDYWGDETNVPITLHGGTITTNAGTPGSGYYVMINGAWSNANFLESTLTNNVNAGRFSVTNATSLTGTNSLFLSGSGSGGMTIRQNGAVYIGPSTTNDYGLQVNLASGATYETPLFIGKINGSTKFTVEGTGGLVGPGSVYSFSSGGALSCGTIGSENAYPKSSNTYSSGTAALPWSGIFTRKINNIVIDAYLTTNLAGVVTIYAPNLPTTVQPSGYIWNSNGYLRIEP